MQMNQFYLTNLLREPTQTNINERAKFTANTGMALVDTANSSLTGSGTIATLLTAAASGTQVKSITIKSIEDTTEGNIRFFIFNGASYYLIDEIPVPPSGKSGTYPAWEMSYDCEWSIEAGYSLCASTENGTDFIVTVEALDWTY
jgi:hypothetical protein